MWRTFSPPFCLLIEEWFWIWRSGTPRRNEDWHLFFFSRFFFFLPMPPAAASALRLINSLLSYFPSAPGLPAGSPTLPQQGLPPSGRWWLLVGSSDLDDRVSLYSPAWLLTAPPPPLPHLRNSCLLQSDGFISTAATPPSHPPHTPHTPDAPPLPPQGSSAESPPWKLISALSRIKKVNWQRSHLFALRGHCPDQPAPGIKAAARMRRED